MRGQLLESSELERDTFLLSFKWIPSFVEG